MALTQEEIIKALKANGGFISYAAEALGVTYHAIYDRIQKSAKIAKAYKEIHESHLDLAENNLISRVKNKDLNAITFYLKYKGQRRGYQETNKHEISGPEGKPIENKITVEFSGPDDVNQD